MPSVLIPGPGQKLRCSSAVSAPALGPGARSLGLQVLAENLELTQAATERRGRIWWRTAEARKEGLVVVAVGPYHKGKPPEAP